MMTYSAHFSKKIAGAALVCVCAILLAWAAPAIVLACDEPDFLSRGQSQQLPEPVEVPTEIEDASDDPIVSVAINKPGSLPAAYTLQPHALIDQNWSPTALVRPPNPLNSI
jgi:hypothetical protein